MRHFHLAKNKYYCPTINVDSLWSLVSEQTRARAAAAGAKKVVAKKPATGKDAKNAPKGRVSKAAPKKRLAAKKLAAKKKRPTKFVLDCSAPVQDGIMDPASFEQYLQDKIKVRGKTGNLGSQVTVTRDKAKINVGVNIRFSKRALKFYAKKYLKKQQLRDWLRVIATNANTYELRYYNIHDQESSESEGED